MFIYHQPTLTRRPEDMNIHKLHKASTVCLILDYDLKFSRFQRVKKERLVHAFIYFAYPGIILAIENRAIHINKDSTKSWYSQEKLIVFFATYTKTHSTKTARLPHRFGTNSRTHSHTSFHTKNESMQITDC